jgi:hypothetical protein
MTLFVRFVKDFYLLFFEENTKKNVAPDAAKKAPTNIRMRLPLKAKPSPRIRQKKATNAASMTLISSLSINKKTGGRILHGLW